MFRGMERTSDLNRRLDKSQEALLSLLSLFFFSDVSYNYQTIKPALASLIRNAMNRLAVDVGVLEHVALDTPSPLSA
jgi:hypothetical protein